MAGNVFLLEYQLIPKENSGMEKTRVVDGETFYQHSNGAWFPYRERTLANYASESSPTIGQSIYKGVSMLSKKALNKLNGLKAGEANYIELSQPVSENREIKLDLAHILAGSSEFQGLKLGESALVKDVTLGADSLNVSLSIGKVTKEETEAVRVALQKLVEVKA